jgi:hypothetical protein
LRSAAFENENANGVVVQAVEWSDGTYRQCAGNARYAMRISLVAPGSGERAESVALARGLVGAEQSKLTGSRVAGLIWDRDRPWPRVASVPAVSWDA